MLHTDLNAQQVESIRNADADTRERVMIAETARFDLLRTQMKRSSVARCLISRNTDSAPAR